MCRGWVGVGVLVTCFFLYIDRFLVLLRVGKVWLLGMGVWEEAVERRGVGLLGLGGDGVLIRVLFGCCRLVGYTVCELVVQIWVGFVKYPDE